jgi:transcriptional regulator with XRE-family HTH domain
MSLAQRIFKARERAGLTLDQLAERSDVSKTYLWELENDKKGEKRPSADVLLKIANALSITIAELLSLPTVQVDDEQVDLSRSLVEFIDWMKKDMKQPLSENDVRDLAMMRFRGGQPKSRDDWFDLFRALKRATGK